MRIPRVACINDLSGFGRCSLTTAISVMSAAGVQVCPVPTAVLSKHTGFDSFYFSDLTDCMTPYMKNLDDIYFDGIYSGFLGSEKQIKIVEDFILKYKSREHPTCIIIDPVMGDCGKLYPTFTDQMSQKLKKIISYADLITPNITEACFLTKTEYKGEDISVDKAKELSLKLADLGCKRIALTGIVNGSSMINMTCENGQFTLDKLHRETKIFSGTGDIFASVVCAFIMKGTTVAEAVSIAGRFISMAIENTITLNTPLSEGVVFEPVLHTLGNI